MSTTGESSPARSIQPSDWVERQARAERLHRLLDDAVSASGADAILLSGGLDTSIVATLAASQGQRPKAFCVSVADAPSPDEDYARSVAARLGLELQILRPRLSQLVERMPEALRILRTFDPMELRNSVVIHWALEAAARAEVRTVLTGDAADELFAGYSYMFNMAEELLAVYRRHLNEVMHFTSIPLGQALGLNVELPYLHPSVRTFALTLGVPELVGERNGRRFGKMVLREAFAHLLPEEIAWRVKTPIEHGSGSTALGKLAVESVTDGEFEAACERASREDGVRLRDKEQYFYYRIYRKVSPPPRELPRGPKNCSECQGPVGRLDQRYCRICGAYPI